MKPFNRKNYGSIPHLSNSKLGVGDYFIHIGQEKILTEKKRDKHDEIFVFEKYDGSNVGIGKINNKIIALTRSGYLANTSPFKQHHLFNKWVYKYEKKWKDLLNNDERIVGEWLIQAHGIRYYIKDNVQPIVFFDHFNKKNKRINFDTLSTLSNKYELQLPRLLHKGDSKSVESLIFKLNQRTYGIVCGDKPEGMVYRVERKGEVDFLAKWVRKDFQPGKYMIDEDELTWNIKL